MTDRPSPLRRLGTAIRRHPLLVGAFGLALVVCIVFSVRSVMFAVYWSDPAHRDQRVEEWMTPAYVAHSWDVPRDVMEAAVGGAAETLSDGRPTLKRIAAAEGIPTADLIARIETAIATHRAGSASE